MTQQHWKRRLENDLRAMGLSGQWKSHYFVTNRIAWFMRVLRLTEHRRQQTGFIARSIYIGTRLYYDRLSERMGFDIPLGVFGSGLSIAHRGTIIVNGQAQIGRNCRIHPGVTIGAAHDQSPTIGNDVFIGPGVGIFGGIVIGDGVVLGPHSLINTDVPAATTTVAPRANTRPRRGLPWSHPDSLLGPTFGDTSSKKTHDRKS